MYHTGTPSNNTTVSNGHIIANCTSATNPCSVSNHLMINLALTGSSSSISNCMPARLKRNLWTKITIVANLDCTVSIDLTVFTNPTIISDRNGTFAFNRADNCRSISDWTPDSTE